MKSKVSFWGPILVTMALAVAFSSLALADSATVSYQGLLRTTDGKPVDDGDYTVVFAIYDDLSAGSKRWEEPHGTVAVKDGVFNVALGSVIPFSTLFSDYSTLWLEISADTGSGLESYSPRVSLASVPYAKHAENATNATEATHATSADSATSATSAGNADTVDGQHAAEFAAASHSHAAEEITSGTVSTDRFSAYSDLVAEGKIGTASDQVAAGNHTHAALDYYWSGSVGTQLSGYKALYQAAANGITTDGTYLYAPVAGLYYVHFQQLTNQSNATYLSLTHNGTVLAQGYMPGGTFRDMIVARVVPMNAGDWIAFRIDNYVQNQCWGGAHSSVSMSLIE